MQAASIAAVASITVDIALGLPDHLRAQAVSMSDLLAGRLAEAGLATAFRLGQPHPRGHPGSGPCEPHVSLFMLEVDEADLDEVRRAVTTVAGRQPAVPAAGSHYRHNPQGAPELFFTRSPEWFALQQAVVSAVEPARRGRLRDVDPSGASPAVTIARLRRDDPGSSQLDQLLRYGYDEITDDRADRFNPHVTLVWPTTEVRVDLAGLTTPEEFSGMLDELIVYRMSPNGTCTSHLGAARLAPLT